MPKGVPLTRQAETVRRQEIVRCAVRLRREGDGSVSMRQLAAAAGVGKSTLYDYFPGRDDIVAAVREVELGRLARKAREIAGLDLPATERLARILGEGQAAVAGDGPAAPASAGQRLSAGARRRLEALSGEHEGAVAEVIRQGVEAGLFRPMDPAAAARAALGAVGEGGEAGEVGLGIVLRGLAA